MRAPDGTIITAYELHDCEDVSLIKYDALSVESADRIHTCIDLLTDAGYIDRNLSLRERYEKAVGVYNLDRTSKEMWEMVWNHKILSLFQMEQQSGIQGIALTKPKSVDDLAHLNSIIRLMPQEKGAETPLEKYARFKNNINLWYDEMHHYGLVEEEIKILEPILKGSYGICESQEVFMQLVQIPECGGFDLNFADQLRKSIAKKNPKAYNELTKKYFKTVKEKGLSENLCNYVWNVCIATSRGYGFNLSHTLAYSLIALQEMNLAYHYPIIYWNCACLITEANSTILETQSEDLDNDICEEIEYKDCIEEFVDEDDEDDNDDNENQNTKNLKKKKNKSANFGKIAKAIGKITAEGVVIAPPNINKSSLTFSPDEKNNQIIYGLSGIVKVGEEVVRQIIANRPYSSISDFLSKVKVSKPQMINLIKCGAFDDFGDRTQLMHEYVNLVSDTKKRITLQNMKMLIDFGLIPEEFDLQRRVFNFNKYLKKMKLGDYYGLDNIALSFLDQRFSIDNLIPTNETESGFKILQKDWDKIYKNQMDIIRPFVKTHADELLEKVNYQLTKDLWEKYCLGSISKWEMDSVSYYSHPHELQGIDLRRYGVVNYFDLPEQPQPLYYLNIKGKQIPIYEIVRIAGTVLDKDKTKKTVTLLTTEGVVTVKIYGAFPNYDKQISEIGADGKKHVIRKSEFTRGNKIIVTGIKRDQMFFAKKYKSTPYNLVDTIEEIHKDGTIKVFNRSDDLI